MTPEEEKAAAEAKAKEEAAAASGEGEEVDLTEAIKEGVKEAVAPVIDGIKALFGEKGAAGDGAKGEGGGEGEGSEGEGGGEKGEMAAAAAAQAQAPGDLDARIEKAIKDIRAGEAHQREHDELKAKGSDSPPVRPATWLARRLLGVK